MSDQENYNAFFNPDVEVNEAPIRVSNEYSPSAAKGKNNIYQAIIRWRIEVKLTLRFIFGYVAAFLPQSRVICPRRLFRFEELEPQTIRRLDTLGPFGQGHQRPRFVTHDVKFVGNPYVEMRGQHVRIRVAKGKEILPARLVRGVAHFEMLRKNKRHLPTFRSVDL